ncbi:TrmJ/YjtD family RNA methyltransferase [Candidatus Manganitrophus noduliformans]|uniref:TrmJ/YjtD family RNA methyltransferase n=1 Tax=Candidatus Manganitrophus noduliformans TaxID=2606439 RepID=UPI00143B7FC3|nr:TrmJ/YjtD family RNA methyltransferase [Candidatus Manganitrophus noduliformans]
MDSAPPPSSRIDRITFCLVSPESPGNIGSAARALKNMGFSRLALVSPTDPRGEESIRMAYRSREILNEARLFPDLSAALSETEWVVGISGRKRRGAGVESIETLAAEIWERAGRQKITLLFGSEGTGLSNEALSRCHRTAFIPTGPRFSSLNLAQAVLLVAAALHRASSLAPSPSSDPNGRPAPGIASVAETESFFHEMERTLEEIGFLKPPAKKKTIRRLREILMRAEVDSEEAKLLRAMFRQMLRAAGKKKSN